MDYSIRIPATKERYATLEKIAVSTKELPKIKDFLFKPKGIKLKDFDPNNVCIRLREFTDQEKPSTLQNFTFTNTKAGYTDEREDLGSGSTQDLLRKADELGFEKWGEMSTHSREYNLNLEEVNAQVLSQEITSVGTILKIESDTQEGLNKALKLLSVSSVEKIEKNAAVLLAEKLNII